MRIHFKAVKPDGKMYEGDRETADKFALARDIGHEGDTLISTTEIKPRKNFKIGGFFDWLSVGKIKIHDKIIVAKNLGAMLQAGLALSRCLSVLERQVANPKMKVVLSKMNEDVTKGQPLSEAMKKFPDVFSSIFYSIVRSGEESGNLAKSLGVVTAQLERTSALERKIKGALIYPAIIVLLILIIGVVMFIYVVPKLTSTFEELKIELPLSTQIIISASNFIQNNLLLFVCSVVALGLAVPIFFRTSSGKKIADRLTLEIPVIKEIVKEVNSARSARTMASLLSSGVNIVTTLEITADVVQNTFYKKILIKAGENIQKGVALSTAFVENEKYFPAFFGEMASAGEETGNLSGMLGDVGNFYETEVDQKTKDFSAIIEPLIMVFVGAAVGIFAYAMVSPMYSLAGSV